MTNDVEPQGYSLLKIAYDYRSDSECFSVMPVSSIDEARAEVEKYKQSQTAGSPRHYFALVQGAVLPTAAWTGELPLVHHVS